MVEELLAEYGRRILELEKLIAKIEFWSIDLEHNNAWSEPERLKRIADLMRRYHADRQGGDTL